MATRLVDGILRLVPRISFRLHNLEPPTELYVTQEDELEIDVRNILGGAIFQVNGRVLTPREGIKPFSHPLEADATRLTNTFRFTLGEGFLLSAVVSTTTPGTTRGSSYAVLKIRRGSLVPAQTIASGYVYLDNPLSFPPWQREVSLSGTGRLINLAGTDPAAGVEISEAVPANTVWRIEALSFLLVTSPAGIDRRVGIEAVSGVLTTYQIFARETQAAATTIRYTVAPVGFWEAGGIAPIQLPLPENFLLEDTSVIRTTTQNLAAGDNFGAPHMRIEEWLET